LFVRGKSIPLGSFLFPPPPTRLRVSNRGHPRYSDVSGKTSWWTPLLLFLLFHRRLLPSPISSEGPSLKKDIKCAPETYPTRTFFPVFFPPRTTNPGRQKGSSVSARTFSLNGSFSVGYVPWPGVLLWGDLLIRSFVPWRIYAFPVVFLELPVGFERFDHRSGEIGLFLAFLGSPR